MTEKGSKDEIINIFKKGMFFVHDARKRIIIKYMVYARARQVATQNFGPV
jgi:hypothetical protein